MYLPVKQCLLHAAISAGLGLGGLAASPALADQADEASPETADLERIQVTGSRIRREEFEAPSPVTVLTREQIARSEFTSLGDILAQLPQLNTTFTSQNSNRFIGTAGQGLLDLRGLGTARTLVLINGKRHVASGFGGSQAVDVNSIPAEMIERVEIVTGANSAVHGADAVAGTVNFILRDQIEGTTVNASWGFAEDDTSFHRRSIDLTHGLSFADGRGSAIFSLGYADQDRLTRLDRGGQYLESWSFLNNPHAPRDDSGIAVGSPEQPVQVLVPNVGFHDMSFGGAIFGLPGETSGPFGPTYFLDDNGVPIPVDFDAMEIIDSFLCGGVGCVGTSTTNDFNLLQVPLKRWNFDANFKVGLGDNHHLYFENRFVRVRGQSQSQPSFDLSIPIFRDNPFISQELGQRMDDAEVGSVISSRMHRDLGMRLEDNDRKTFRHVAGIEGLFDGPAGSFWEYDAFANFGRTELTRRNMNNRINDRWWAAIDAIQLTEEDLAFIDDPQLFVGGDPQAGDIVCRATLIAASSNPGDPNDPLNNVPVLVNGNPATSFVYDQCVPANHLGENISPEAADWINTTALATAKRDQFQVGAVLHNQDWLSNWAGRIPFVVGVEYRRESLSVNEDSLSADPGATFFNALGEIDGDFDVSEVFGEFAFPLARGITGVHDLTFEGAARWSDYSTVGHTFTWETRLQYSPIEPLTFRATRGDAIRAPNLGELFDPPSQSFSAINHPCDMNNLVLAPDLDTRINNCIALGIADPLNFIADDTVTTEVLLGGNPDLEEEKSNTWTAGVVWSPEFIQGLDIAIDYWDINITNAIASTSTQAILNRCVDDSGGIDNQFCELFDLDENGDIELIRQSPVNLNEFVNRGVDLTFNYSNAIGPGHLNTSVIATYLRQRKEILNTDNDVDYIVGQLGNPRWRVNWDATWSQDFWTVFGRVRWISSQHLVTRQTRELRPFIRASENMKTGSSYYFDLGAGFTTNLGIRGEVVVSNVFDRDPPAIHLFGTGAGDGLYDNVGRFFTFKLGYDF